MFCFTISFSVRLWSELNNMEVFARVFELGGVESKMIKEGFDISFGTRIVILVCTLYWSTVGRDKSIYGIVLARRLPVSAAGPRLYQTLGLLLQSPRLHFKVHTKTFPWVGKGSVMWRWPDTANVDRAYTDTSRHTALCLSLVLQPNKDFTYTYTEKTYIEF